jgi:hypothetical protein
VINRIYYIGRNAEKKRDPGAEMDFGSIFDRRRKGLKENRPYHALGSAHDE